MRLSHTALQTLQQCGEKYRRKYIERDRRPANLRMIRGAAVHRAAQHNHRRQLEVKSELIQQGAPLREIVNAMRAVLVPAETATVAGAHFEDRVKKEEWEPSPDEKGISKTALVDGERSFTLDMAVFHTSGVAPGINPTQVEHRVEVTPADSDITIAGIFDLVSEDLDGVVLSDLKVGAKSPSKGQADRSQQLSMYALLHWALYGKLPAKLRLDHMVRTPARHMKSLVQQQTHRTEQDLTVMVNRLNAAAEGIEKGVFMPAPADAWWCSARFCEYHVTCPYVNPFRHS